MNPKTLALAVGLLAASAAQGITYSAGSVAPTFTANGVSHSWGTRLNNNTTFGLSYLVDIPTNPGYHVAGPTGTFTWDFYMTATPGKIINQIRIALDSGNSGFPTYRTSTITAAYYNGSGYTSIAPVTIPNSLVGTPAVQVMDLPGLHNLWHISFTNTWSWSLPNGMDFYGGSVSVKEAVPEPGTFAALGLGGLALLARRRRHA